MNAHTLSDYLELFRREGLLPEEPSRPLPLERPVALVSCDSQQVAPGTLFVCKGRHFREEYLRQAAAQGAFCYLSQQEYPDVSIPCIRVSDIRLAMARAAALYYGNPWEKLDIAGITGTKGKSTTAYYVKSILDQHTRDRSGENGLISSIDTYDGAERFESHLTTPEPLELHRHFANAAEHGLKYFVMEVSSQALKYRRVEGVRFSVACFLNIDYDHISPIEHPDWEDYFASKLRIFRQCRAAVVNLDAKHADRALAAASGAERTVTFSQQDPGADIYGYDVHRDGEGIAFRVRTAAFDRQFRLGMPGLFNVQNALAAIAICTLFGVSQRDIYVGLMRARVPGRMEVYANANRRIVAIVDYAHNALSFEKLFQSVREEYAGWSVSIVFGCPGKKALDRRRDLGELAGRYAQHVYLTEEDPGEEDAGTICRQIAAFVAAHNCPYTILLNRDDAIRAAVMDAKPNTVILVTGKGAETREKRGLDYIPVPSDVEYVKQALQEYDHSHRLDGLGQVRGLLHTLPPLYACNGKIIVIKYGGAALAGADTADSVFADVAALRMAGASVVLVHGGGKSIDGWLSRFGVQPRFSGGYRVTDDTTMEVVEMSLSGQMNKKLVTALCEQGIRAVGVSGRDGGLLRARQKKMPGTELGRVGEIESVDPSLIRTLLDAGYVPVISPVAAGADGGAYNVNADEAACAIAEALGAENLIYLTDVDGVLMDTGNEKTLLHTLSLGYAEELLAEGMISGGMAPKLSSCVSAIHSGIRKVMVLDGRVEHTVLQAIATGQFRGTVLTPDRAEPKKESVTS